MSACVCVWSLPLLLSCTIAACPRAPLPSYHLPTCSLPANSTNSCASASRAARSPCSAPRASAVACSSASASRWATPTRDSSSMACWSAAVARASYSMTLKGGGGVGVRVGKIWVGTGMALTVPRPPPWGTFISMFPPEGPPGLERQQLRAVGLERALCLGVLQRQGAPLGGHFASEALALTAPCLTGLLEHLALQGSLRGGGGVRV